MQMPGFTAELSLPKKREHYQAARHAINTSQMSSAIHLAAKGKDFPNHTCDCQGCAPGGGDVTGQCDSVCKDKEVYAKGSYPHDYCTKTRVQPPRYSFFYDPTRVVALRG